MQTFLLWATGPDKPGFVAAITKVLYDLNANLEDSSMMRLGSEFGMFMIFTCPVALTEKKFANLHLDPDCRIGLKKISRRLAKFTASKGKPFIIRVHGKDSPGIVHHVAKTVAAHRFNITDLSTHRVDGGKTAGYILLIEGELLSVKNEPAFLKSLIRLRRQLNVKITIDPILAHAV